jgi:hypothetical protein
MSLTGFSPTVKNLVKERAGTTEGNTYTCCEKCGLWSDNVQTHHRRARQRSSNKRFDTNRPSNALVLCLPCHDWVESNRESARASGWLLKQFQTPSAVPVKLWDGTFVLSDDGSRTEVEEKTA